MAEPTKPVVKSKTTQNVAIGGGLTLALAIAAVKAARSAIPDLLFWEEAADEMAAAAIVTALTPFISRTIARLRDRWL